ncbi:hypothetical protein FACS18949_11470 [Clostridia bacterium]|nr:hypothetical protein FACS18949_11470 [Clostridia bacterium]
MKAQAAMFCVLAALIIVVIGGNIQLSSKLGNLRLEPVRESVTVFVTVSPSPAASPVPSPAPDYQTMMAAGVVGARGPGLTVTLTDRSDTIHDSDLLMLVNELRDAGAEALSLNGQRLTATSEIRCAGAIVSVNNTRVASPFIVRAIGPSDTMYSALNLSGGVGDTLKQWGFVLLIERASDMEIGPLESPEVFRFASPVPVK